MTFRDLEIFDVRPHFDSVEAGLLDDFTFESHGLGIATPWRPTGGTKRTVKLPIALHGLDEVDDLRRFFDRHRGRQRPFWLPAYVNDFELMDDADMGDDELTVSGHGFNEKFALGSQFQFIALITRAGKLECYGVTAVDDGGDDDVVTLSRGLDSPLVAEETVCCPLLLARASEDELVFDYLSGDVIRGEIEFTELPQEYPDADEDSSAEDSAHFGARPVFLYRISDGTTTLRLADYGVDVAAAGETWEAADISHGNLRSSRDLLGDAVDVTLRTADENHPLRAYLNELNLAHFTLEIFEADLDDLEALDLNAPVHSGVLENVSFQSEGQIAMTVSSIFRLGEREIPTMHIQRTCNWRTYDGIGCKAVAADFTTEGTVTDVSDDPAYIEADEFGAKATAEDDENWFALGLVTIGAERRICTGQDGNRLYLNYPFRLAAPGQTVSALAGDDKRVTTCQNKFGQLANHSGAPYIPNDNPQTAALKQTNEAGGKKG